MSLPLPTRNRPLLCYVTDSHAISPDWEKARGVLLEKIKLAASAGVDWIQIREKQLGAGQLARFAQDVLSNVPSACRVLLNDRLDVACAVDAGGVHLGEDSLRVEDAKRFLQERGMPAEFIVGVSVHSMDATIAAERAGADYVVFGPVFATPSKEQYGAPQGLQRLQKVCGAITIPVIAIGGITTEKVNACMENGARGIAAIRLFQDAADVRGMVESVRGD